MGARLFCKQCAFTISFIYHQTISQLHNAAFDALQLVTGIRQHQHHEKIDHAGHFIFALTDTDRLDVVEVPTP